MDRLVTVLDEKLLVDLRQCNVLDDGNRLVRPLAVESLLEPRKWNMLRLNLAAARPGSGRCNLATHLLRPPSEAFHAFRRPDNFRTVS